MFISILAKDIKQGNFLLINQGLICLILDEGTIVGEVITFKTLLFRYEKKEICGLRFWKNNDLVKIYESTFY